MPDYSGGKIYRITNSKNDTIYVGSTCLKILSARMASHRSDCKRPGASRPFYTAMREIGIDQFTIHLEKNFPCKSKDELEAEEYRILNEYIAKGVPVYNDKVNGRLSLAHKRKLSKAMQNYGCVCWDKTNNRWYFRAANMGNRLIISASVRRFGYWRAKWMMYAERQRLFPNYSPDPEEEFTDSLMAIEC